MSSETTSRCSSVTVEVIFEGRVENFPAHYEDAEWPLNRERILAPDSQPGISFIRDITGKWYAFKESEY